MGCTIPAPPKKFNAAINANDLFVFIIIRAFVWQGQPLTPAYWLRIARPPFKNLFSTLNTVSGRRGRIFTHYCLRRIPLLRCNL